MKEKASPYTIGPADTSGEINSLTMRQGDRENVRAAAICGNHHVMSLLLWCLILQGRKSEPEVCRAVRTKKK